MSRVWADEVDEIARIGEPDVEAFYVLCAIELGDPDTIGVAYNPHGRDRVDKFNEIYETFFKRRPSAFSFLSYIIWYEKQQKTPAASNIERTLKKL